MPQPQPRSTAVATGARGVREARVRPAPPMPRTCSGASSRPVVSSPRSEATHQRTSPASSVVSWGRRSTAARTTRTAAGGSESKAKAAGEAAGAAGTPTPAPAGSLPADGTADAPAAGPGTDPNRGSLLSVLPGSSHPSCPTGKTRPIASAPAVRVRGRAASSSLAATGSPSMNRAVSTATGDGAVPAPRLSARAARTARRAGRRISRCRAAAAASPRRSATVSTPQPLETRSSRRARTCSAVAVGGGGEDEERGADDAEGAGDAEGAEGAEGGLMRRP